MNRAAWRGTSWVIGKSLMQLRTAQHLHPHCVMGDVQEAEGPDHAKHGTIDKLTISKIIFRTVLAGQLQFVSVALPLSKSSQGAMDRQFVVAAGVPLNDKLLQKVCTFCRVLPCLRLPFCWKLSALIHALNSGARCFSYLAPQVATALDKSSKAKQQTMRGRLQLVGVLSVCLLRRSLPTAGPRGSCRCPRQGQYPRQASGGAACHGRAVRDCFQGALKPAGDDQRLPARPDSQRLPARPGHPHEAPAPPYLRHLRCSSAVPIQRSCPSLLRQPAH